MSILVKTLLFVNQFQHILTLSDNDRCMARCLYKYFGVNNNIIVVEPHCRTIVHFVTKVSNLIH